MSLHPEGDLDTDLVEQFLEPILMEAVDESTGKLQDWAYDEEWKVIYPLARLGQSKHIRAYLDILVDELIRLSASSKTSEIYSEYALTKTFLSQVTRFIQEELQSKIFELEVLLSYVCLANDIEAGKPISDSVEFLFEHKTRLLKQDQINGLFEDTKLCPFHLFHRARTLLPHLDPFVLVVFWAYHDAACGSAYLPFLAVLKGIEESQDLDGFMELTAQQKNVMVTCAKASGTQALYDSLGALIWSELPSPTIKVLQLMLPVGCASLATQLLKVVQEPSELPPHFLPLFLNEAQLDLLPKALRLCPALKTKIQELICWDVSFFLSKSPDEGDMRALEVYNEQMKRSAEFKAIVKTAVEGI